METHLNKDKKMKIKATLLLAGLMMCSVVCLSNKKQTLYEEEVAYDYYRNDHYGYTVAYPLFLIPEGEGSEEGQTFVADDGVSNMQVYHTDKTGLSLEEAYRKELEGRNASEKQLEESFYRMLWKEGKNTCAQYTFLAYGSFYELKFRYTPQNASRFEAAIPVIVESLTVDGSGREEDEDSDGFITFLFDFLDVCFYEKNLNRLIRDKDPRLASYIDPQMGLQRYYAPGAFAYLAGCDRNFGFDEYGDFTFEPSSAGEISVTELPDGKSVCELEFENEGEVYYESVEKVPDVVVNVETLETKAVILPYPDAEIRVVYVPNKFHSPVGLYFVLTPDGWKFVFIDDTLCGA